MSGLVVGIQGLELDPIERELIAQSPVNGVILFSRNYKTKEQLTRLTQAIHAINPLVQIMADHEGGKVQRFRDGFTAIPSAHEIQEIYLKNKETGLKKAFESGKTMAQELIAVGVDLSLAPVLDLDVKGCDVISGLGRSYGQTVEDVIALSSKFIEGMQAGGMPGGVGKHFPGHSYAKDTHLQIATDSRELEAIMSAEGKIYKHLINENLLFGIMPAHVIYPKVDDKPAGFSTKWMNCLRKDCGFTGKIYSDDLNMKAAESAGSTLLDQVKSAQEAGCDYILICQTPAMEILKSGVLELFKTQHRPVSS